MKNHWSVRFVSLVLALLMLPGMIATADHISSNGNYIQTYNTKSLDDPSRVSVKVENENATNEDGWYTVSTGEGQKYVPASAVSKVTPSASPTITPDPAATPTPVPSPTATQAIIEGEKDTTYTGEILSFTVPSGSSGLWLYSSMTSSTAAEVIAAGTTVKLTEVVKCGCGGPPTCTGCSCTVNGGTCTCPQPIEWYSVYHKGKTYYVKAESLSSSGASATLPPASVKSVVIGTANASYFTGYNSSTQQFTGAVGELVQGKRINATYVDAVAYKFTDSGKTYYFRASDIQADSQSSVSVVGNDEVSLVTQLHLPAGVALELYPTPSKANQDAYVLNTTSDTTLNAQSSDEDGWYKVVYSNKYWYVNKADFAAIQNASSSQVVNDPSLTTSTFWVTAGVNGAYIYDSYSVTAYSPPYYDAAQPVPSNVIAPGTNARVGTLTGNSNWYTYDVGGITKYVNKKDFSGYSTSTDAVSAYRIRLYNGTKLYDRMDATDKAAVTLSNLSDGTVSGSAMFVVNSINEQFYSIAYNSKTYYILKSELTGQQEIYEIANTTDGRTYTITLSSTGVLYKDASCTQPSGISYPPGTSLTATRYTASLYTVTVGGVRYYLPVACIGSISGGDDTSGTGTSGSESIGDIMQGEKDDNFTDDVFSYTIPSKGLWLYHETNLNTPAISLDGGKVIQLSNYPGNTQWYATYYGGVLYAVPKSSLTSVEEGVTVGTGKSIVLTNDVALYASVACNDTGNTSTGKTGETIGAGTRINVKVASYLTAAEKNAMPASIIPDPSKNYVRAYSTEYNGKTRYFPAYSNYTNSATYMYDPAESLDALLASNTDASLVTKFTFRAQLYLYTSNDTNSSAISLTGTNLNPITIYGVKSTEGWYKVAYNSSVWYLNLAEYNALPAADRDDPFQVSVAGDVASNTYTVVIGSGGVKLYTRTTATETYRYYSSGTAATFPGGMSVMATLVSGWYSCTFPNTSDTVYFQNTGVSSSSSNASVRSYIVTIPTGYPVISVYTTISLTTPTKVGISGFGLQPGETYTLRTVDTTWSSVTLSGKTYYVKNSDIPSQSMSGSLPVGSTTVGKTYTITIGDPTAGSSQGTVPMYQDSKLTNLLGMKIPGGHTTTGTKLYVEGANNTSGLVYEIKYNGTTGYIDAKYVVGVKNSDETDEIKEAEKNENAGSVEVGSSSYFTLNAGSTLYSSMSTSSDKITLPTSGTYLLTRIDSEWFRLTYGGKYYYMRVSDVISSGISDGSGSAVGGADIPVGQTFMQTLRVAASAYDQPSLSANIVGTVLPNQLLQLTKVSDYWYELDRGNGSKVYLTAADVFGAPVEDGSNSNSGQTTDGTGIITPNIRVNPASGSVNLRRSATLSSTIMARIPKGTIVPNNGYEVDGNGQVWYKTTYEGKVGYVIGTYIEAVGTVSSGGSTADPSGDIGRSLSINVSTVNIRSGPGTNYSIVGRMDKNQIVVPTSYSTGTDNMIWYGFNYSSSQVGYIRYDYVDGGVASTTELSGNVAIKSGGTNLRSGAGSGFSIKAKLERDTIVTIVGSGTDSSNVLWYRVTYLNLSGYVRSDLVRALTTSESSGLFNEIVQSYTELKYGSTGTEVLALQQQLIALGYLASGSADGTYGMATTNAVKAFQAAKGMSQTGVATAAVQAALFNTTNISSGSTSTLDWFSSGYSLINLYPNVSVYDINTGVTWNAKYVEGGNHADVVPASSSDAQKLKANNITGSYVRRPVIVTINGQKFAGSLYAVGHGSTNFVSYFSGVMCIHFTGSKTHGTGNVDADHQSAIQNALNYANSGK